jgi:hypothetical protein
MHIAGEEEVQDVGAEGNRVQRVFRCSIVPTLWSLHRLNEGESQIISDRVTAMLFGLTW